MPLILKKRIVQPEIQLKREWELFPNRLCGEIFYFWHDHKDSKKMKLDVRYKTFRNSLLTIVKWARLFPKDTIIESMKNYLYLIGSQDFYPDECVSIVEFFDLDQRTIDWYSKSKIKCLSNVTSWFMECNSSMEVLVDKFCKHPQKYDKYPKVTDAIIAEYSKFLKNVAPEYRYVIKDSDRIIFQRAAKNVVQYHQTYKFCLISLPGINDQDVVVFAKRLVQSRYHFSQDNVSQVEPNWFSSEGAYKYLTEYLLYHNLIKWNYIEEFKRIGSEPITGKIKTLMEEKQKKADLQKRYDEAYRQEQNKTTKE